jgi:hypothetical protein
VFTVVSPFRLRVSHHLDRAAFPIPATSNVTGGFPALRFPVCFTSRVTFKLDALLCTFASKCANETDESRERSVGIQFIIQTRRERRWIA